MSNTSGAVPGFAVTERQNREDEWAPMEPVAPPSDYTIAAIALLPVWGAAAWVIYTLLH